MNHNAYVQSIQGGEKGFFASCPTCGCGSFPDRVTPEEAEADANRHRMTAAGAISDRDALAAADQHDIQTRLK